MFSLPMHMNSKLRFVQKSPFKCVNAFNLDYLFLILIVYADFNFPPRYICAKGKIGHPILHSEVE